MGELLHNLWCGIFHRRHIFETYGAGEWCDVRCFKCEQSWAEPRFGSMRPKAPSALSEHQSLPLRGE